VDLKQVAVTEGSALLRGKRLLASTVEEYICSSAGGREQSGCKQPLQCLGRCRSDDLIELGKNHLSVNLFRFDSTSHHEVKYKRISKIHLMRWSSQQYRIS